MRRRNFLSGLVKYTALGSMPCSVGCGTIFHSERNYRPHSRDIDWKVAALNGLGLLFFFVPGVVAFIVDFHTGAIYLPPEYVPYDPHNNFPPPPEYVPPHDAPLSNAEAAPAINTNAQRSGSPALQRVVIPKRDLHSEGIQAAVEQQLGTPIDLEQTTARVSEVERLDEFDQAYQQCRSNPKFGIAARQFFRDRLRMRSRA